MGRNLWPTPSGNKIDEILLLYPDTIDGWQEEASGFTIRDEFADQVDVRVKAHQLPVINRGLFEENSFKSKRLNELFQNKKRELKEELRYILFAHILKESG